MYETVTELVQRAVPTSTQVISENLGMKLVKRVDNIVANIADYYIADKLGIRVGQPVLTIESVTFNERNVPIYYCISHLPGDGYSYTVIRDRDEMQ